LGLVFFFSPARFHALSLGQNCGLCGDVPAGPNPHGNIMCLLNRIGTGLQVRARQPRTRGGPGIGKELRTGGRVCLQLTVSTFDSG